MSSEQLNSKTPKDKPHRQKNRRFGPENPNQSVDIQGIVKDLALTKAKLEVENRRLKAEIQTNTGAQQKYLDLYNSLPIGYFLTDSNGMILEVNSFGAIFLGTDQKSLIQRPFSLYINGEDLVLFYIHRKNMLSDKAPQTFMVRINKSGREVAFVSITISPVPTADEKKPHIKIILTDKSLERKTMDDLEKKNNILNLLFSIINEVTALQGNQKKEAIIENLEILALLLNVDRIFFALLNKKDNSIADTYVWNSKNIRSHFKKQSDILFKGSPAIFQKLVKRGKIELSNIPDQYTSQYQKWLKLFPVKIRALYRVAVIQQTQMKGILGYECVNAPKNAGEEEIGLMKIAAKLLYSAIEENRKAVLDELLVYDGPIDIIEDESQEIKQPEAIIEPEGAVLNIEPCTFVEAENLMRIFPHQDKLMISCPFCKNGELLSVKDLITIGKILKLTCICRKESFILIEMRKYFRKSVSLFGFFIRKGQEKINFKSRHQWGRIHIKNISKHGIGFEMETNHPLEANDTLELKFSLDNNTNTIIRKDVTVMSVNERYIGCRFVSKDQIDVTLGFYLMSK